MKKIDFLITYEVKGRELEYLTLLMYELNRRGYKVALAPANALWGWGIRYCAEVVIGAGVRLLKTNFGNGAVFRKFLELTPEQVYTNEWKHKVEERDDIRKCVIVNAWGEKFKDTLIYEQKMPQSRVVVYGHPALDFCKRRFVSYYMEKSELAKKYHIDSSQQWNLFISSFTLGAMGESGVKEYDRLHGTMGTHELFLLENKTIEVLVKWFTKIVEEKKDHIIIYRPHPVELIDKRWLELEKIHENFRIIRGESVRQWIKASERVYSWISTSTVEAYYMGKSAYLLRPIRINPLFDMEIFKYPQKAINSYHDFYKSIATSEVDGEHIIFDESISEYYSFDADAYTYERLADLCERIFEEDEYVIPQELRQELYSNNIKYWKSLEPKTRFIMRMRGLPIYRLYYLLSSRAVDYMLLPKREIRLIQKRIDACIKCED